MPWKEVANMYNKINRKFQVHAIIFWLGENVLTGVNHPNTWNVTAFRTHTNR